MDLLTILLIVVALLAISGWGYGTYYVRPAPGTAVEAPVAWVNPVGIIALLAVVGIVVMLSTGWRPTVWIGP